MSFNKSVHLEVTVMFPGSHKEEVFYVPVDIPSITNWRQGIYVFVQT